MSRILKYKKEQLLRFLICFIAIIFLAAPTFYVFAAQEGLESSVKEELRKAKIPNAAVSVMQGENVEYFFHSVDSEQRLDKDALFQLGSVSKAYTGLGILLLEDEGNLSLNDPVSKYLPWFAASFQGQPVPEKDLTIANLLYQTSGFTNEENKYPNAVEGMSLTDSVQSVSGKELTFYPSQQFAYSNTNYRILGLIIEAVSGQSYDEFMTEQILQPLGLMNTYANLSEVQSLDTVIQGSRLSFFRTWRYDIPAVQANVPAGYLYSNAQDMSRWLQIQSGQIEAPEQFERIIKKSHQPNIGSDTDGHTHYAAGWFVSDETGEIYHSGGTPNYSANVMIRPDSNTAVCILTNINLSANTNNIAKNVLNLLDEQSVMPYVADVWTIFDSIFSWVTIVGILGVIGYAFGLSCRIQQIRKGDRERVGFHKRYFLSFVPALLLSVLTISVAVVIPLVFASPWADMAVWAPISVMTGLASLILLSIFAFCFSFTGARFRKVK